MKNTNSINYLLYGNSMDHIDEIFSLSTSTIKKKDLFEILNKKNDYLKEIVRQYDGTRTSIISTESFLYDLKRTQEYQKHFIKYKCRGFSYTHIENMKGFPFRMREAINIRNALIAPKNYFYPINVKKYVNRNRKNHYFFYDEPSIAFYLGTVYDNDVFIFTLQSDIIKYGPSCIREHFRGWRKVLFAEVLRMAKRKKYRKIYLINEKDVLRSCHKNYPFPKKVPSIWESIYSLTAFDFQLKESILKKPINIQLFANQESVFTDEFYELDLVSKEYSNEINFN
jgi:hypothetical protein